MALDINYERETGNFCFKSNGFNVETLRYVMALHLPAAAKLAIMALAYLAPNDDGVCAASHVELSRWTGNAPPTVARGLKMLLEMGLVEIRGRAADNAPYEYAIVGRQGGKKV
jgi:hypothetical protein